MIRALAHLCFRVRDLDASVAFYRDALGMTEAFDFTNDDGLRTGAYLRVGGRSFIELFAGDPAGPDGTQTYQHFCLEVDDLPAAVSALRDKGVDVSEPKLGKDRSWQAWIADPDGNRIELHQYTDASKQLPWVQ
jgi:catechol 2,3-dioxygenase-like lactoylglutathione lyase family enzyme